MLDRREKCCSRGRDKFGGEYQKKNVGKEGEAERVRKKVQKRQERRKSEEEGASARGKEGIVWKEGEGKKDTENPCPNRCMHV